MLTKQHKRTLHKNCFNICVLVYAKLIKIDEYEPKETGIISAG